MKKETEDNMISIVNYLLISLSFMNKRKDEIKNFEEIKKDIMKLVEDIKGGIEQ